jgi:hypothetical protein
MAEKKQQKKLFFSVWVENEPQNVGEGTYLKSEIIIYSIAGDDKPSPVSNGIGRLTYQRHYDPKDKMFTHYYGEEFRNFNPDVDVFEEVLRLFRMMDRYLESLRKKDLTISMCDRRDEHEKRTRLLRAIGAKKIENYKGKFIIMD